jgi:hypothetical protein
MANRASDAAADTAADDPWAAAMRRADFEGAWRISDRILRQRRAAGNTCWHLPRHLQWVWDGRPVAGKRILVRCYHGLGDTIQFIRFAQPLRALASEVIVWAQPELLALVAGAAGVDRVLPLHDGAPDCDYDVDLEIMELPHALRADPDSIARHAPYLFPTSRPDLALPPDGDLNVGLVWTAGDWDPGRSIPIHVLARLTSMPGIRFHSLQRGPARAHAEGLAIADISSADVDLTAARMQQLDLIISVDTMAAHLAGALSLPVWTLLQADADWRWMAGGSRSVWYPTMRLLRQHSQGHWDKVIEQTCRELANEK